MATSTPATTKTSFPFIPSEIRTAADIQRIQVEGLRRTVAHAYANSPVYRAKLDAAHVAPADVRELSDLARLPFTTADDFRDGYPFPLLSVAEDKVVRVHASSGTTGRRKVVTYTQADVDDWAQFFARALAMAGVTARDRALLAVGFGLWTAGMGFAAGLERLGAMVVPSGPANSELQIELLVDMKITTLCCTASMAVLLAEEVEKRGVKPSLALERVVLGSEPTSAQTKERIKNLMGVKHVFDIVGLTELYGPGTGIDCEFHQGIHYWADYYILELLNPETLQPVSEGETGEMVVTTLRKEATPLIRYRTRDMARAIPGQCPCGCIMPRHSSILGRSDDMITFRGVKVYPGLLEHIVFAVPSISGTEYQVVLKREAGKDFMVVKIERMPGMDPLGDAEIRRQVEASMKRTICISAIVEIVPNGTLPRTPGKTKRVVDTRQL